MLKEIWVEDEEELVCMVMVEVKTCHRELWSIIDKIELGYHQLIWREEMISDLRCPLNLSHPDWSSLGTLPVRTSLHSTPDRQAEQNENTQNQLNVPSAVEMRTERARTSPSEEVDISPQTDQPGEDQNMHAVVESAPLNIEIGTQRTDVESNGENVNNIPPSQVSRSVRPSLDAHDLLLSRNVP